MNRNLLHGITLLVAILILFSLNLLLGSVSIPMEDICAILFGGKSEKETWQYIILESRLPQAITALLAGASLAASGLLLQTTFRNPLAGPDVFGINSGAALAVALVMLGMGGTISVGWDGNGTLMGFAAILTSAFVGAMCVTGLIFLFATIVRNHITLLIIGIMIGYLSSSAITILNYLATEEGVKSYVVWGMGTFGNVSLSQIPLFSAITLIGLLFTITLIKPLNALLLGDEYAKNLGVNIRQLRYILLAVTGILTAIVTAFCGPIAFIGLATPHIARLMLNTENHRLLLPNTLMTGSCIALLCNLVCNLPADGSILPLNAITPLIGAPVIIYVLLKRH